MGRAELEKHPEGGRRQHGDLPRDHVQVTSQERKKLNFSINLQDVLEGRSSGVQQEGVG